jgi:hypothetical protein
MLSAWTCGEDTPEGKLSARLSWCNVESLKLLLSWTATMVILLITSWLSTQPIEAQSVVFSDDFSSDLEKWQPVRDHGEYWQIKNGRVEASIPIGSTITELVPKDHYWDSRWHNFIYEFEFTPLAGVDRNISFGFQDTCNWYETHFVDGLVHLVRLLECSVAFGVDHNFTLLQYQTYHFKITFNDGRIFTHINEVLLFDEVDWTFNQNYGKIGLKAGTGSVFPTTVAFDNVKVTLLDSSLGVPLLKQSDSRWGSLEYDSAHLWATAVSINRWGCALVSMAMILQYHGISTFINGIPITPESLNDWLIAQPDGYLGNGILNWLAVTRLTRELSENLQTPKLEYGATTSNLFPSAVDEIHQQKPVVLQIDGHFLVADGVNQLETDLLIKDPAYVFTYFSQHQTELLSVRTFQPSQTDLSYILVTHGANLQTILKTSRNEEPPGLTRLIEKIQDAIDPHSETSLHQLLVPKPVAGSYSLEISQAQLAPFNAALFIYDRQGNPTIFHLKGLVGPEPKVYTFRVEPDITPTLQATLTWHQFRNDLYMIREQNGFWGWPVFWMLEWSVYQAESKQLPYAAEILRVLALQLSVYRPWMTENSYRYLAQQLNLLGDE